MQKEYIGLNSIYNLSTVLDEYRTRKILLVTGKSSFKSCGISSIIEEILGNRKVKKIYNFSVNPNFSEIITISNTIDKSDFDMIIAVGGGSVIDFAKSLNVKISNNNDFKSIVINNDSITNEGLPLVAIPTTAGTGSETTHFTVVYIKDIKQSLAHPFIKPTIAIVDPQFTYNLPPFITACSGLDAFCQAIESYWSVNASKESKKYASDAISKIKNNLIDAVKTSRKNARDELLLAANLSGKAIDITKTTAPHAISYPLTKLFNIPHGYAVALILGQFFLINETFGNNKVVQDKRGSAYVKSTMIALREILGWSTPEEACQNWYKLIRACGLTTNLSELGIIDKDIKKIAHGVNVERLSNNPISIKKRDVKRIIRLHIAQQ